MRLECTEGDNAIVSYWDYDMDDLRRRLVPMRSLRILVPMTKEIMDAFNCPEVADIPFSTLSETQQQICRLAAPHIEFNSESLISQEVLGIVSSVYDYGVGQAKADKKGDFRMALGVMGTVALVASLVGLVSYFAAEWIGG